MTDTVGPVGIHLSGRFSVLVTTIAERGAWRLNNTDRRLHVVS